MKQIKIAMVAFNGQTGCKESNLNQIKLICQQAVNEGVQFICFPELALVGGDTEAIGMKLFEIAEKMDGPATKMISTIAKHFGLYIGIGMPEKSLVPGRLYSSLYIVGPEGAERQIYKKRYFDGIDQLYMTGSSTKQAIVKEYPWGKMSIALGADIETPEFTENIKNLEVDLILALAKQSEHRNASKLAEECKAYVLYADETLAAIYDQNGMQIASARKNELMVWTLPGGKNE